MKVISYNSSNKKNNIFFSFFKDEKKYLPTLLLMPAIIIVLSVVAFPMLYSLIISFTDFSLLKPGVFNFVGFNNYINILQDIVFWQSFGRTIIFITIALLVEIILGLIIANMMSHVIRGQSVLRTMMMMPMMFAPVLVGFQFKWFFNDQVGLLNNILYAISGRLVTIPWLVNKPLGFITILIAEIWMSTPFLVIVFLAGILGIPQEVFEAAEVDGASEWNKFRFITIPYIAPFIYIGMAIRILGISKAYDLVILMTSGGPANRTELIWTYVYKLAFVRQEFALGTAMSYITVIISWVLVFFFYRRLLKK